MPVAQIEGFALVQPREDHGHQQAKSDILSVGFVSYAVCTEGSSGNKSRVYRSDNRDACTTHRCIRGANRHHHVLDSAESGLQTY